MSDHGRPSADFLAVESLAVRQDAREPREDFQVALVETEVPAFVFDVLEGNAEVLELLREDAGSELQVEFVAQAGFDMEIVERLERIDVLFTCDHGIEGEPTLPNGVDALPRLEIDGEVEAERRVDVRSRACRRST